MEAKKPFGEYIRKKRLDAGLTQKELAQRLYVTESTISKWERSLSYPDISMVTAICEALGISEHEFFTACDDDQAHTQERAAAVWQGVKRSFYWICAVSYAIAILACFICDLAIFHTLDWFWIVLTSLALAFCFTNLPFLLRRDRLPICMAAATGCLLLLLLSCWLYAGGWWIVGGLAITAASLALPWGWWAIWRFYGRHILFLCAALTSVWVFALLAVVWAFAGGSWLLGVAYPIAAAGVAFGWAGLACVAWLPAGPWLKAGVFALIAAFATPALNCLSAALIAEQDGPRFPDYFDLSAMLERRSIGDLSWVNILIFWLMLAAAAALLVVGGVMEYRRRRGRGKAYPVSR